MEIFLVRQPLMTEDVDVLIFSFTSYLAWLGFSHHYRKNIILIYFSYLLVCVRFRFLLG
jgi:hypothetical protein